MCDEVVDKNYIPVKLRTQEMCDRAIDKYPWCFRFVADKFKTQELCEKAVDKYPENFEYVPDRYITQEMCEKTFDEYPELDGREICSLDFIPDKFKTREICEKAVDKHPENFKYIPDCFITREMIGNGGHSYCKSFYNDKFHDWFNDEFHAWFNGYKQRKTQKAQIKAELLPIAWHPDRVIDWCFDEEEKKDLMRLWGSVDL